MSTNDVPGAKAANRDVLAMGCWAEHDDGSLVLVEGLENGTVVYSMFDLAVEPPVEYRDAMPEAIFKDRFTWKPDGDDDLNVRWVWHDKTPFVWDRVMRDFASGQRHTSAIATLSAAARVAQSLDLRAEAIRGTGTERGRGILTRIGDAVEALLR